MTNRILRYSGLGLVVLAAGAMAACGSDDPGTPAGVAGKSAGGSNAGGSAGVVGLGGSITAGSAGTGTAGSGTAGNGSGGAGAGFACAGTIPTAALITDFSNLVPNATSAGNFTFAGGVLGGTFSYQPGALTLDTMTNTVLNVKGNVSAYDGFGLYFNTCYDASAYTGISFNIKGYAGPKGKVSFRVQTNTNTAIDTPNMKGSCVTATPTNSYADCHASEFSVPVTAAGGVVTVMWSQLTGGVPIAAVTGKDVVGLEWALDWTPAPVGAGGGGGAPAAAGAGGASAGSGGASGGAGGKGGSGGTASGGTGGAAPAAGPYDANVTIDDIMFLGGPPAGGAGGAGGTGAGGTGAGGASAGSGGASAGTGGASAGSGGKAGGN